MRRKKSEGIFLKQLEHFVNVYMPDSRGLSKNTIISYKAAFRILILFFYEKKGVPASDITFEMLTLDTLNEFLDWLEKERSCSPLTRNQRLAALYSFSEYAQNRNFEAASCFRMAVIKIPMKKAKGKERAFFTPGEIKILLELPDSESNTGLRDKVLLSVMYASGARAQEICFYFPQKSSCIEIKAKLSVPNRRFKMRGYTALCIFQKNPDLHMVSAHGII